MICSNWDTFSFFIAVFYFSPSNPIVRRVAETLEFYWFVIRVSTVQQNYYIKTRLLANVQISKLYLYLQLSYSSDLAYIAAIDETFTTSRKNKWKFYEAAASDARKQSPYNIFKLKLVSLNFCCLCTSSSCGKIRKVSELIQFPRKTVTTFYCSSILYTRKEILTLMFFNCSCSSQLLVIFVFCHLVSWCRKNTQC